MNSHHSLNFNKNTKEAHAQIEKIAIEAKKVAQETAKEAHTQIEKIAMDVKTVSQIQVGKTIWTSIYQERLEKIYKAISEMYNTDTIELKALFLKALLLNDQYLLKEILQRVDVITTSISNIPRNIIISAFQNLFAKEGEEILLAILMNTFQSIPEISNVLNDKNTMDMKTKKQLLIDLLDKTEAKKNKAILSQVIDLSFDARPPAFRPFLGDVSYQITTIKSEDYKKLDSGILDTSEFILLTIQLLKNQNAEPSLIQEISTDYLFVNYKKCINTIQTYCKAQLNSSEKDIYKRILELSNSLASYDPTKNDGRCFFETRLSQYIIGLAHTEETLETSSPKENIWDDSKLREETVRACNKILMYYLGNNGIVNTPREMEEKIAIFANLYKDPTLFSKEEMNEIMKFHYEEVSVQKGRDRVERPPYIERRFEENPAKVAQEVPFSQNPGTMNANAPNYRDAQLQLPIRSSLVEVSQVASKNENKHQWFWENNRQYAAYIGSISGHTCNIVGSLLIKYIKDHSNDPNLNRDINLFLLQVVGVYAKRGYHGMLEVMDIYHDNGSQKYFKKYNINVNFEEYFKNELHGKVLLEYAVNDASNYVKVNVNKRSVYQGIIANTPNPVTGIPSTLFLNKTFTGEAAIWKVPTINVTDFLMLGKVVATLSTGKKIRISDLKYTILDDKNVVFRHMHELAELSIATGEKNLINLVAFRPERIALHQAIATVITQIQYIPQTDEEKQCLEHDIIFLRIAKEVLAHIKDDVVNTTELLNQERNKLEAKVTYLVKSKGIEAENSDNPYLKMIDSYKETVIKNGALLGKHIENYSVEDAIISLVTDAIYKTYATNIMIELVENHINQLVNEKKLSLLECPEHNKRQLFLIAGGQASGKGSAYLQLKYSAEQAGIQWVNVSKGGGDTFRSLLLDPTLVQPELYSQLCQNEASYISHTIVINKLQSMAEKNKAPHVFIEQLYVSKDKLDLALINEGNAKIIVVSTDVEKAIIRSFQRGNKTGRYENVKGILTAHKGSTAQLPDRILESVGKAVNIRIVDNNGAQNEQPTLIADIDCKKTEIIIYNEEKLKNFIKKTAINVNADKSDACYDQDLLKNISIENNFPQLNDHFKIVYLEKNNDILMLSKNK